MKDLARHALDVAKTKGASYADARFVHTLSESIATKNGELGEVDRSEDLGFGVRAIANGAWGFAASSELTKESVAATAARAVEIAKASSSVHRTPVALAPEEAYVARWQTPYLIDPFSFVHGARHEGEGLPLLLEDEVLSMEITRRDFLVLAASAPLVAAVPSMLVAAPAAPPPQTAPRRDPYALDELPLSGGAGECSGRR